jgi:hypothetical protein
MELGCYFSSCFTLVSAHVELASSSTCPHLWLRLRSGFYYIEPRFRVSRSKYDIFVFFFNTVAHTFQLLMTKTSVD